MFPLIARTAGTQASLGDANQGAAEVEAAIVFEPRHEVHQESTYLKSYALGQLPGELSIMVALHLKSCVSCTVELKETRASIGHWTAGAEKHKRRHGERRKNPRVPSDDPGILTILHPEGAGRIETRVLDASKEGMKLLVPHELMSGMVVHVHIRDLFILAEVRYCRPVGARFHAGVLIQDVFGDAG